MSLSGAFITVTCDKCEYADDIKLTSLAGGGWDERSVERTLISGGWVKDGEDKHICEGCADELRDELEMEETE